MTRDCSTCRHAKPWDVFLNNLRCDKADKQCPRCRGEGWLLQRAPRLGPGLYEVTCEHCNGHGAVAVDAEDEVEDWMRDE